MAGTQKIDGMTVLRESYDAPSHSVKVSPLGNIAPSQYDRVELAYSGANLTGVDYILDGSTVKSVTLEYDGSNLTGVNIA